MISLCSFIDVFCFFIFIPTCATTSFDASLDLFIYEFVKTCARGRRGGYVMGYSAWLDVRLVGGPLRCLCNDRSPLSSQNTKDAKGPPWRRLAEERSDTRPTVCY